MSPYCSEIPTVLVEAVAPMEEVVMPIEVVAPLPIAVPPRVRLVRRDAAPIAVPPRVPLVRQRGRQYLLDNNVGIYEVDEDGDVVMGE